jgi:hypothetical protein
MLFCPRIPIYFMYICNTKKNVHVSFFDHGHDPGNVRSSVSCMLLLSI